MSAPDGLADGRDTPRDEHSDAILERLLALHPKAIDLSLERLERLLAALGHPERTLAPVVHVAGTNGKGSVCAYLRAGLSADGGGVQVYTSPHLARFHERIRLTRGLIDEAALARLLAECEAANAGQPITFFEITTAAAFLAFARERAEWLVLEVGLGGRLDATNVVARPRLCVITPIGLDHLQYLGPTVGAIAAEKAGILKPGVTAVIAPQPPEALAAIEAKAAEVGAPLHRAGREWRYRFENGRLQVEDARGLVDLPAPRLLGRHQHENAATAVVALRLLGAGEAALAHAMERVEWPARLQRLKRGPLVEAASPQVELWLDGGHNAPAGEAIAAFMGELEERTPAPLYLIVGMINTKDVAGFLRPFQGLARRVLAVTIPGEANAVPAEDIAAAAVRVGLPAQTAGSIEGALRVIAAEIENDVSIPTPRALICGSLYLAGRVLRDNG